MPSKTPEPTPAEEPKTVDLTPDFAHLFRTFAHDMPITLRRLRETSQRLTTRDIHGLVFTLTTCLNTATSHEELEQVRTYAAAVLSALTIRLQTEENPPEYQLVLQVNVHDDWSRHERIKLRGGLDRYEAAQLLRGYNALFRQLHLDGYVQTTMDDDDGQPVDPQVQDGGKILDELQAWHTPLPQVEAEAEA